MTVILHTFSPVGRTEKKKLSWQMCVSPHSVFAQLFASLGRRNGGLGSPNVHQLSPGNVPPGQTFLSQGLLRFQRLAGEKEIN